MNNKNSVIPNFLEALTPDDNVAQIEAYSKSLKWAIDRGDVYNVALTGPYGSGKSSVLKTFKKNHDTVHQFLEISLATFNANPQIEIKGTGENGTITVEDQATLNKQIAEQHRLIELSIVQQIFYQAAPEDIPYSRFKRISAPEDWFLRHVAFFSLLFILGICLVFFPSFFDKRLSWWNHIFNHHKNGIFLIGVICILPAAFFLISYCVKLIQNSRLSKFKLSDAELEFNSSTESSILNQHIDEILYFFESTEYDVVIIEDLDRFDDPELFTKLREINLLINKSKKTKEKQRGVTFIYAVRDDMFTNSARSKFFDFIIPVIPVVNTSNSFEVALKKLKNAGIEVSQDFLSDITLYINDMRVLKNIFNEFCLYYETLNGKKSRINKLFAIIVYKNIYPKDFADLHLNKGLVYSCFFTEKSEILKALTNEKEKMITALCERIDQISNEAANDTSEVVREYGNAIFRNLHSNTVVISINGTEKLLQNLVIEDILWVKSQTTMTYRYRSGSSNYQNEEYHFNFSEVENAVDPKVPFNQRLKNISDKLDGKRATLHNEIDKMKREISAMQLFPLKDLLNAEGIEKAIPKWLEIEKLLLYLVRKGYLDETYPSLISYFYEGSITLRDRDFLLSVKDRQPLELNYSLDNVFQVLGRLNADDFSRSSVLNYDLVRYLSTSTVHLKELKQIAEILTQKSARAIQFLENYDGKNPGQLINVLASVWPGFWQYLLKESNYPRHRISYWLVLIVRYAQMTSIEAFNIENLLRDYISESEFFFSLFFAGSDLDKAKKVVLGLGVKFSSLNFAEISSNYTFLEQHNLYELNVNMINSILLSLDNSLPADTLSKSNYSIIKKSKSSAMLSYVKNNIEEYVNNVVLNLDTNTDEDEDSVIDLLNSEMLSCETADKLIQRQTVRIEDVARVTEHEKVKLLFLNNKVVSSWLNIYTYYHEFSEIDKIIAIYLDSKENYTSLSSQLLSVSDNRINPVDLLQNIILSPGISADCIRNISAVFPRTFTDELKFDEIPVDNLDALLLNMKIPLSPDNFDIVKQKLKNRQIALIEQDVKKFLDDIAAYNLDAQDLTLLLNSSSILLNDKIKLIRTISPDIINGSKELAREITRTTLSQKEPLLSFSVLESMFEIAYQGDSKVQLLMQHIPILAKSEIIDLLKKLDEPYNKIIREGRQAKLENTAENTLLATMLTNQGIISSFKPEDNQLRLFLKKKYSEELL